MINADFGLSISRRWLSWCKCPRLSKLSIYHHCCTLNISLPSYLTPSMMFSHTSYSPKGKSHMVSSSEECLLAVCWNEFSMTLHYTSANVSHTSRKVQTACGPSGLSICIVHGWIWMCWCTAFRIRFSPSFCHPKQAYMLSQMTMVQTWPLIISLGTTSQKYNICNKTKPTVFQALCVLRDALKELINDEHACLQTFGINWFNTGDPKDWTAPIQSTLRRMDNCHRAA